MSDRPHTLYRFFDSNGALLYVGRTVSPSRRWREHELGASWFDSVAGVTREVHATAADVAAAERVAIETEAPVHNIALNPNRRVTRQPRAVKVSPPVPADDEAASLALRWKAIEGYEHIALPVLVCEQDETVCECADCHSGRLRAFEDLRAKFDWHPDILSAIEAAERLYYDGADLLDWYYELYDIEMFSRMRLAVESRVTPLPAYFEFSETQVAVVECPFCFVDHRHVLTSGAALNRPIESGCEQPPLGMYRLEDDWPLLRDQLIAWGENSAKKAAA